MTDINEVLAAAEPPSVPEEGPTVNIQLGGHVVESIEGGVYHAFARIPDPDEPEDAVGSLDPLAEVRLVFNEDIEGSSVAALFQLFVNSVDDVIQRIDQAREEARHQLVEPGDDAVQTVVSDG